MNNDIIEEYANEMLKMGENTNLKNEETVDTGTGSLVVFVTTTNELYPVPDARITVYTGNIDDMDIVAEGISDKSGKSPAFSLKTPSKSISLSSGQNATPYASYNMVVEADGYVKNIHLNIPVFSGVTSVQGSDLLLLEIAGNDKNGQVFDESTRFDL